MKILLSLLLEAGISDLKIVQLNLLGVATVFFSFINTELLICTTDGSYDGKTPNVASSPRRLSGPLRVVALGGPTEDKFDACAHEWNCYLTVAESIRRQIESSPVA